MLIFFFDQVISIPYTNPNTEVVYYFRKHKLYGSQNYKVSRFPVGLILKKGNVRQ